MEPLEQIQMVRQELQRLVSEQLGSRMATPELREKLAQLHGQLNAAEERLRAQLATAVPTKAQLRAEGDQLVASKMKRVQEIQALKEKHGSAWVFVPTAEERAASAVPPIAAAEMPDLVRSMFEQLKIRHGGASQSDSDPDREIWEDLSQMEIEVTTPAQLKPTPPSAPNKAAPPKAPKTKPRIPAKEGDEGEIWDDLSQMDES
jgi:hypothetical protein